MDKLTPLTLTLPMSVEQKMLMVLNNIADSARAIAENTRRAEGHLQTLVEFTVNKKAEETWKGKGKHK